VTALIVGAAACRRRVAKRALATMTTPAATGRGKLMATDMMVGKAAPIQ
jgi:hypothetical protein